MDIVRGLESLPLIYREVILLRDMEQLTITEVAQRLDITREAAKSRIHRGRVLLREYLRPDAEMGKWALGDGILCQSTDGLSASFNADQ